MNGFQNAAETIKPIVDSSLLLPQTDQLQTSTAGENSERSLRDSDALNENSFVQTLMREKKRRYYSIFHVFTHFDVLESFGFS